MDISAYFEVSNSTLSATNSPPCLCTALAPIVVNNVRLSIVALVGAVVVVLSCFQFRRQTSLGTPLQSAFVCFRH